MLAAEQFEGAARHHVEGVLTAAGFGRQCYRIGPGGKESQSRGAIGAADQAGQFGVGFGAVLVGDGTQFPAVVKAVLDLGKRRLEGVVPMAPVLRVSPGA